VSALHVDRLTKTYGDLPALEPLTLTVDEGEQVALVGHNGSGKTTLLKMAAGLLDPSGGSAAVFGAPAGSPTARADLSWLADTPTFYDDLSVAEHLEYVARMHGVEQWQARGEHLLATLGLASRAEHIPSTFSRGLRQKAAIAIAFVRPFRLLLVDEPFVGLDAGGKQALLELFAEARAGGATLMVATHELSFVDRGDRLIALRDGAVTFDGPPTGTDVHALVLPA
jgi:ABC-2 type transport system ATP-binding protein